MKMIIDQDYHIHSQLSAWPNDPGQTKERLLAYAKENGLREICVTDHFWDSRVPGASPWYAPQDYAHIAQILPLPQDEQVKFYFGCEAELDKDFTVSVAKETFERFDFVIIPTTHLHMLGVTLYEQDAPLSRRSALWVRRLEELLQKDLPFHKIGLAHPTCHLIAHEHFEDHLQVLDGISDADFARLFSQAAQKGMGIELNMEIFKYHGKDLDRLLRPYHIVKACGCKFYFGSDAHHPQQLDDAKAVFERIANLLDLQEEDKFRPFGG